MKKYIIYIVALLLSANVFAQSKDEVIFKAMKDEIGRNMSELKMDNVEKPSFISYVLFDGRMLNVKASLGEIIRVDERPIRNHGTKVMLGNYDCTSDCDYNGRYLTEASAIETDYGQIRREFWMRTDFTYKRMSPDLASKIALRKQLVLSDEEASLPDFLKITPVTKIVEGAKVELDRAKWERNAKELSAVFKKYPALYNSTIVVDINDFNYYLVTSEGTVVKEPTTLASISIEATVRTDDGVEYTDEKEIYATSDLTLADMEKLVAEVDKFAGTLSEYAAAPVIEEFYSGPVLLVDEVVANIFTRNLLTNSGLLTQRKGEDISAMAGLPFFINSSNASNKGLEYRIGQRVLDGRLTVKNVTNLKSYKETDLLGYYEIDSEGVIPAGELTLIENGVMRKMLNGRVPTLRSRETTGSQRFTLNERTIATKVAPGTLKIEVKDGSSRSDLEAELLNMAKADGLKYAYIIAKTGSVNYIYRMDAETGAKTLVRRADPGQVALSQLKKVAGISSGDGVVNLLVGGVPASVIYPDAILLETVEISELQTPKNKLSPLVNPSQRSVWEQ